MKMDNAVTRSEMIHVAEAVSRELGLDKEDVILALEAAISKSARERYGSEKNVKASIDRKTGELRLFRITEIVEDERDAESDKPFNMDRMMHLSVARRIKSDAKVGEVISDPLPPLDFGRIGARVAKQAIIENVRRASRSKEYTAWKDRVGEIVHGVVKSIEYGDVILELGGRTEAMLGRKEIIGRQPHHVGDRIRAYVYEVKQSERGPQIMVSRTHIGFLAKLFAQEVPEIYDGIIEIKAVARDPGSRAKMAVVTNDSSIDPVGACIGRNGSRVRVVSEELQGEKVDIIKWTDNLGQYIGAAMKPANVDRLIDEGNRRLTVIVAGDQLSLAIGKRGQNVRLASQLTGWKLDVTTDAEANEKQRSEDNSRIELFMSALDVDEMIARLLTVEGFSSIEEIIDVGVEGLLEIQDFSEDIATELLERAYVYLETKEVSSHEIRRSLGVTDEVAALLNMTPSVLEKLGHKGVKTLDDVADLSSDELLEIAEGELTKELANAIIMEARRHWFEDDGLEVA
jgi:transcription termination/antitermination protein NusA